MRDYKHEAPYTKQLGYLALLCLLLWAVEQLLIWLSAHTQHHISKLLLYTSFGAAIVFTSVLAMFAYKASSEKAGKKRTIGVVLTAVVVLLALWSVASKL
ncbi:MAG: hypothetical protein CL867_03305 [Cytophagaceae bacterium]|nr:hypothetical protein [Cytophagaceae bacterium]